MGFTETLERSPIILAEGAVIERLRRNPAVRLDEHVAHAAFLYQPEYARVLRSIYRQYLDIGLASGLPMICLSPTWRASPERLRLAGLDGRDVNGDAVRFLRAIAGEYGSYGASVFVGGLIGCRGDAYRPEQALGAEEAARFHRPQLAALAGAGADFLIASTLPALSEAQGIAAAMAGLGLPYILSFVMSARGALLDETPLPEAIALIDSSASAAPAGYLVNCVHHSVFAEATGALPAHLRNRVLGLQANTSTRDPRELEGLGHLETEDPTVFAAAMEGIHRRFGCRILGGCCGTDHRHIGALAARLAG